MSISSVESVGRLSSVSEAAELVLESAINHLRDRGEWGSVALLIDLRNEVEHEQIANQVGLWWVGMYLTDRAFGGREEGGWWYDCGSLVKELWAYKEIACMPTCHSVLKDAWAARDLMRARIAAAGLNEGRPDVGSVCSTGIYDALIFEDVLPMGYPNVRPRYE